MLTHLWGVCVQLMVIQYLLVMLRISRGGMWVKYFGFSDIVFYLPYMSYVIANPLLSISVFDYLSSNA